jgi:hypothetical protein
MFRAERHADRDADQQGTDHRAEGRTRGAGCGTRRPSRVPRAARRAGDRRGGDGRHPRPAIVTTLRELLRTKQLAFAATDRPARAVASFESGKRDFADYVIREQATTAGCDRVATFDRAVLREAGFVAP